jgi:hypothetical protein
MENARRIEAAPILALNFLANFVVNFVANFVINFPGNAAYCWAEG